MNILEAKPEYQSKGKWTAKMEERYNNALLEAKQDLFKDLEIPFPSEIETKFWNYISKGNQNADVYLDNLCHSYIQYAFDHHAEILHDKLLSEYGTGSMTEREMKKILGEYGTKELIRSGLVKFRNSYRGSKTYSL